MRAFHRRLLVPVASAALLSLSCGGARSVEEGSAAPTEASAAASVAVDPRIAWIDANALPLKTTDPTASLEDLEGLKAMVGDARIVALGEGTHGTHEFFEMKKRLIRFLIEEMGFTIVAFESPMLNMHHELGRYVATGEGDAEAMLRTPYYKVWSTEEVLSLVEWMRQQNAQGAQLRLEGVDGGAMVEPAAYVADYLERADPDLAARVRDAMSSKPCIESDVGWAMTVLPAEKMRGKTLQLGAWLKSSGVDGNASIWMRADGDEPGLAFDGIDSDAVTGDTPWTHFTVSIDVPQEAKRIAFGFLHNGSGRAYFDDARLTLDGESLPLEKVDLGFEGEGKTPTGLGTNGSLDCHRVHPQSDEVHDGRGALMSSYDTETPRMTSVQGLATEVRERFDARRGDYVGATSEEDYLWARQWARLQELNFRSYAGDGNEERDALMAEDAAWLLEAAYPGEKIILWAHNSHVSRRPDKMGGKLAERFPGDEMVVIGMTTGSGEFSAYDYGEQGWRQGFPLAAPIEGSVEALLTEAERPNLLLDLRRCGATGEAEELEEACASWLLEPAKMRTIGAVPLPSPELEFRDAVPGEDYDLLIYLDETTSTRVMPMLPKQP